MLRDEKILITGPAGQIAFPMTEYLAADNEVWGIARFEDPATRERVDAVGATTRAVDLASGDLGDLPDDFTYLLHLAAYQGSSDDYDYAISVNAEGAGFLMDHCHKAKAALVMSTSSVYRPNEDPLHAFLEEDPIGGGTSPWAPTYAASKMAQEAVVRQRARALGLPTVIARMNASYGPNGGLPAFQLDSMRAGATEVMARWDPCPYSPIFQDDINEQVEPLLAAASVPATIVNWGGDEIVSIQEWVPYLAELSGCEAKAVVSELPGSHRGMISDPVKRLSLTGPCRVGWREGFKRMVEER
jgi:nucleoside-diphosphate-sugar epimerase